MLKQNISGLKNIHNKLPHQLIKYLEEASIAE